MENFDDFSMYAYDLDSGTNRHLGDNGVDTAGTPYESPVDAPVARAGLGAWIQGSGPDGQRTLRVVDLESGAVHDDDTVVTLDASQDKAAGSSSLRIFGLPSSAMGGCPRRDPPPQRTATPTVRPPTASSVD